MHACQAVAAVTVSASAVAVRRIERGHSVVCRTLMKLLRLLLLVAVVIR